MLSKELITEALDLVTVTYHKIIKANLTKDTWIPVLMYDEEWKTLGCDNEPSLTKALDWFMTSDYIYQDDKEVFKKFADIGYYRKRFKRSKKDAFVIYRRKFGRKFHWVCMGVKPCVTYTDDNQEVMIYIKDIQTIYSDIHKYIRSIEEISLRDCMTRIRNRYSFDRKIEEIRNCKCDKEVSIIYCDINNLKHINDTLGHPAGDKVICNVANTIADFFKDEEIYRVSGDEFVVIIENHLPIKLIALGLREILGDDPIFAFGISSGNNKDIINIVLDAEKKMYQDKKIA